MEYFTGQQNYSAVVIKMRSILEIENLSLSTISCFPGRQNYCAVAGLARRRSQRDSLYGSLHKVSQEYKQ